MKQRTATGRFTRALLRVKDKCRRMMHDLIEKQHRELSALLRGHYNYFGITGNGDALTRFQSEAERIWGRSLARRSGRRFAWQRFRPLLKRRPLPLPHPPRSLCKSEPAA